MSLVCAQCSRVNPAEASYCFYDGAALAGRSGGPINAGSAPFPHQFVFPDGLACRNFDQLAMACQANWASAIVLLKQGFLGSFFGGMGRIDLAAAAQEAAKFPDIDRGLDQLLAKLPTQALQKPKLQAEPSIINLGVIKVNENRASELHLTNLGMRLLYGTVTSDCKWLTLGDVPGHAEKMFQFGAEAIIPVQVRGQHLRAGTKPLEGRLVIDSNGGEPISVTFKADVPITPYAGGLFAGAVTPRQIADKAKAKPKDTAPHFENGDVARWYASNGWVYPVQGPIMPGVASIQQFFEALGVAKAPKVDFNPKVLDLAGGVGKTIQATIEVSTNEKKVIYGWATCDQPWVHVGKTKLTGKTASIPLTIRIPSPCPPSLKATLQLFGNGTQKASIPLKVKVAGGKSGVMLEKPEEVIALEIVEDEAPMVVELIEEPVVVLPPKVTPVPTPQPASQFAFAEPPPISAVPAKSSPMAAIDTIEEASPFAITDAPTLLGVSSSSVFPKPAKRLPLVVRLVLHLIPVGFLFVLMLGLLAHDVFSTGAKVDGGDDADKPDPRYFIKIVFNEGRGAINYTDTMTFAAHKLDPANPGMSVKLNYYDNGFGNSSVVKIDGKEFTFGLAPEHGKWTGDAKKAGEYDGGKSRTFEFSGGILVTQTVTIEPGEPVQVGPNDYKRLLNTCLIRYKIQNRDNRAHTVGLRVLMDTCIGDHDDVPFTLPGSKDVVSTQKDFHGREVPDFVQVLEKASLRDPGTILQLNLRVSDKLEAPNRFQLTRYPVSNNQDPDSKNKILGRWEVPKADMGDDSSVVIYWDPKKLQPKETRELAFSYGLGSVSLGAQKLSVTVGGATYKGGELTVLALVADREAKTATLDLPKGGGLRLADGEQATKPVLPTRSDRPSPVSWRVIADSDGKHTINVTTDTGHAQSRRVTITPKSIY
jgi:hypothetical protein